MSKANLSRYLKREAKRIEHPIRRSIALSCMSGLLLIGQMGMIASIISDILTKAAGLSDVIVPLCLLPLLFLARAFLSYGAERLALHAAIDLKHDLRGRLLKRLIAKGPIRSREGDSATGNQVTMLTEGIEALEGYFARYLPAMVMMVLLPVAILMVTLVRDWLSALGDPPPPDPLPPHRSPYHPQTPPPPPAPPPARARKNSTRSNGANWLSCQHISLT